MGDALRMTGGLAVDGLVAGYDGRAVARLDRLSVAPGEAAVLAGASGSGKTTLLLAIAGLAQATAGSVVIDGEEVAGLSPRRRDRHRGRAIGLVFQDLHLVTGLTALDNLLLAPFASGGAADRGRAGALLDRLGIAARARAETLSRGQAQRVAIARALMMRPRLILADEPTASLDDEAAAAVVALLSDTAREDGAALVVATHDARVRAHIPALVMAEAA